VKRSALHDRPVRANSIAPGPARRFAGAARSDIPVTNGLEEKSAARRATDPAPAVRPAEYRPPAAIHSPCTLIFSTVAPTATTPFADNLTPQSWILRPSRRPRLDRQRRTGTGRIRSTVTRAIRHLGLCGIFSAAQTASARRRRTVLHARVHGPAALGW